VNLSIHLKKNKSPKCVQVKGKEVSLPCHEDYRYSSTSLDLGTRWKIKKEKSSIACNTQTNKGREVAAASKALLL
jgi:hypothetical protein